MDFSFTGKEQNENQDPVNNWKYNRISQWNGGDHPDLSCPLPYWGGKNYMLRYILPMIPPHNLYCEPFFGGGTVFFNKKKVENNIINDYDDRIMNFYEVLRDHFDEFLDRIIIMLASRKLFKQVSKKVKNNDYTDKIDKAVSIWYLISLAFRRQLNTVAGIDLGAFRFEYRKDCIQAYRNAFLRTLIECKDALQVIKDWDRGFKRTSEHAGESFFYIDPPYYNSDCKSYKGGNEGFTEQHFIDLLDLLGQIKGKFILSSYPSDILYNAVKKYGWYTKQIEKQLVASTIKGKRKIECLTWNYPVYKELPFDKN